MICWPHNTKSGLRNIENIAAHKHCVEIYQLIYFQDENAAKIRHHSEPHPPAAVASFLSGTAVWQAFIALF